MMKFMAGPANSTATRFQTFCLYIAYGASPGLSSSTEVMPAMSQNPPSGIALTPYSVEPSLLGRCVDHSVGPKPTKYRRTFIPVARATHMCPHSCSATDTRMASANSTMPITNIIRRV